MANSRAALALLSGADQRYLEEGFRDLLPLSTGLEHHLRAVLADVLGHPGSLARAQLSFTILAELGAPRERARALAVALEYFHTASLLFDDLPAMDDARERRGRPCPHVLYGEAAAVLGALALITEGYHLLWSLLAGLPAARQRRAGHLVAQSLGLAGLVEGQARDLHFAALAGTSPFPADKAAAKAAVQRVAEGKTVPLVRLALVLPALLGKASRRELDRLERLASAWGLAYQGLDDCKDLLLPAEEAGKSTARDAALGRPNLVTAAGWSGALAELDRQLKRGRRLVTALAEG
ncbi:MAG TPA: polyprenyl synthetase family protein, partial [Thermoanaerobaculia bacterium]|nr:polyprenyl synthetase family protein [Thermoanaerobaculia bacterium]